MSCMFVCSMVTDHCTLLLAESALSHTSSLQTASASNSQADSDINMPLDHLTPKPSLSSSQPDHNHTHFLANSMEHAQLQPPKK